MIRLAPTIRIIFAAFTFLSTAISASASEDDQIVAGPLTASAPQAEMQMHWPDFDQWVFGGAGGAREVEDRVRARYELQLAEIDRACALTDAQKAKLTLAARGDLRRFIGEAETARRRYDVVAQKNKKEGRPGNQEGWMEMQTEIQELQQRIAGGLTSDDASLFMKTLTATLTAEQLPAYRGVIEARRRFRYEADVESALIQLEQSVFLNDKQRDEIIRMLTDMPPPRTSGQYANYVVLLRLASLSRQVKPLLTLKQWQALSPTLDQYRGVGRSLVESGYLNAEDLPAGDAKEKK